MADSSVFTTDLGAVTAYADAKAHGYTGTREEFATLLANAGNNLAEANAAKTDAQASATQAVQSATAAAASARPPRLPWVLRSTAWSSPAAPRQVRAPALPLILCLPLAPIPAPGRTILTACIRGRACGAAAAR